MGPRVPARSLEESEFLLRQDRNSRHYRDDVTLTIGTIALVGGAILLLGLVFYAVLRML